MQSESLAKSEELSATNAPAPRVSLESMKAKIKTEAYFNLKDALESCSQQFNIIEDYSAPQSTKTVTVCVLVMNNGFVIIGKSSPASAENFDEEKGRTFAYEDAIRQLWPFEGYALREKLVARDKIAGLLKTVAGAD